MSTRQILSSTALGLVSLMLASAAPAQQAADPTKNSHAGHRRDAAQSAGGGLADVAAHL